MKTRHFINQLAKERLVKAVQEAERGNSADVVLFISHKKVDDAMLAGHKIFQKLKLGNTTPQNSILIFLAPENQKLAVIGGTELYAKLPPEWWSALVGTITASFKTGQWTEGLLAGFLEIGNVLREHFPAASVVDRTGQSDLLEDR